MRHDSQHDDTAADRPLERREVLRRLALLAAGVTVAAGGAPPVRAQGGGHAPAAAVQVPPQRSGPGRPEVHAVPWDAASCALCNMTIATPEGFAAGPGFRERTYAQWAFRDEARHFESIGCAIGWAWAHAVTEADGAALYVAPYDLGRRPEARDLLRAVDAVFLWGERLPTSMQARWGAFRGDRSVAAFVASFEGDGGPGRTHRADQTMLTDLAPLPVNNLVALLARQMGLLG